MAKYQHKVSGKIVEMSKDNHKKLRAEIQDRYVEVVSPAKKKKSQPKEADEQPPQEEI